MRSLLVVTAVVALLLAASCKGKTDEPMDQIHDFHEHNHYMLALTYCQLL